MGGRFLKGGHKYLQEYGAAQYNTFQKQESHLVF